MHRATLTLRTRGRGTIEITDRVNAAIAASQITEGLCHLFLHHTSAALLLGENADPQVRRDLDAFLDRLVPDGDPLFLHNAEGPDDMPAHVRSVLTGVSLTIPVTRGRADLGTWQGIYVWEHRASAHERRVTVTVL